MGSSCEYLEPRRFVYVAANQLDNADIFNWANGRRQIGVSGC
jgi:hypothetical protein